MKTKIKKRKMLHISRILLVAMLAFSMLQFTSSAQACPAPPNLNGGSGFNLPTQPGLQCQIVNSWAGFMPVAIIAVLLSFAIAAFIFITGTAVKSEAIKNFGVGEIMEAASTAIIVGSFFVITGLLLQTIPNSIINTIAVSTGSTTYAPTTQLDPYVAATSAISNTINVIQYQYDCVLRGNTQSYVPDGADGLPTQTCPIVPGSNFVVTGGGSDNFEFLNDLMQQTITTQIKGYPISSQLFESITLGTQIGYYLTYIIPETSVAGFLTDGLYLLWGIYYLLIFFSFVSPVFIILGIIIRAIFPVRSLGGIMIAVGMGFYLVAPLLFSFLYSPNINPYSSTVVGSSLNGACTFSYAVSVPPTCSLLGTVLGLMNGLWLQIVFFPILIIAITYSFITQIASFLGASPQGIGRMRTFI